MNQPLGGNALVICGPPRSGTSAAANAFRSLGYFFGEEKDFPPIGEGNPKGIFERPEILAFNARCHETMYMAHDRPDWFVVEEHPAFPRLVSEASAMLRKLFHGQAQWGWKEPMGTLLLPIYKEALKQDGVETSFLVCVRRPLEVVESQQKIIASAQSRMEAQPGPRAYRRWTNYVLKALKFTKGEARAVMAFHELLERPRETLQDCYRAVNLGRQPHETDLDRAASTVEVAHYRNRTETDVPQDAPESVRSLWQICNEISRDQRGLNEGAFDREIAKVEEQFLGLERCFSEPEPPYGAVEFKVAGSTAGHSQVLRPSEGWNRVELLIQAPSGAELQGTLFPFPAKVYARNAKWGSGEAAKMRGVLDTLEKQEGVSTCYDVGFSKPQVSLRAPIGRGPYKLSMDLYVEMNVFTAFESAIRQTRKVRQLEAMLEATNQRLRELESRRRI